MKAFTAALPIALLASCSDSTPPPVFGGFEPVDQAAVIFAPATCDIPFVGTASVAAVGVAFTDYSGACAVLAQTQFCGTRASSATVLGVAVSGLVGGGPIDPAGPGTYPYLPNPPTSGAFRAIAADAGKVDAACDSVPGGSLDLAGGQIILASIDTGAGGAGVTGSVDLRFDDGSRFEHGVDAAICPVTIDVCNLFVPCGQHACVQPAP